MSFETSFLNWQLVSRACLVLISGAIIGFISKLYRIRRKFQQMQKDGLPMPPHHALFGHLRIVGDVMSKLPSDAYSHVLPHQARLMFPELGPIFYLDTWPFGPPIMVVGSLDGAHKVTQVHSLPKFPAMSDFLRPMTGGKDLVTMEGNEWKHWRNVFNPGFSSSHLKTFIPEMLTDVSIFCEILRELAAKRDIFLIDPLTTRLSLDVIGRVTMGTCLNSQTSTNDFVSALRSQIRWLSFGNEANLFERYHPLRPIMTWWNNRRMVRYVSKQLDDRLRSNVAKKDSAEIGGRKTIIDLALSNYLTEKEESSKQIPSSHGMDATFHDIAISQIRIFAFAGHDTTSSTMCYAFHLLSKNPSIRQSLIAEHNDVFGQEYNQTASLICGNPHLLNQLPYTLAVIKETLRLYPPASSTRRGEENYFINGLDGRHLPTNEFLIWINAYSIHHDPTYWPEPDEFIPERWLVPERHRLYPLKGAYRPFEFGPRNCIGQELAMLELKVVLVMTVREFDIVTVYEEWDQLHPRKDPKHLNGNRAYQVLNGSAHPSDGLPCRVSLSMKGDKDANVDTK